MEKISIYQDFLSRNRRSHLNESPCCVTTHGAILRRNKFLRLASSYTAGCGTSGCESVQKWHTHARTQQNESYARRTFAKLTRLECGTRAGWQCKFIQNSKEPSARSTSPTSTRVPPIPAFLPQSTLSRRLCPFRKTPAGCGSPRKTANYTLENSAYDSFYHFDH